MKNNLTWAALAVAIAAMGVGVPSYAHEDEEHKNLQALADDKDLEPGMKSLSKGLGVKCVACHIKGEFDSDKVAAKVETRKFLVATVGVTDKAKREEALKALLSAMKIDAPKSAADIWKGVDMFKKKAP